MARTKGDGGRSPLKRMIRYDVRDSDSDWSEIEQTAGIKLPPETREKIHMFAELYSSIGPMYSPKQSILSKDVEVAITTWLATTETLIKSLTPADSDLNDIASSSGRNLTAVGMTALIGILAKDVGQKALEALSKENRNGRLAKDLWAAWACLTTRALQSAGLNTTGKSLDKSNSESPYVNVMIALQEWLPGACRERGSYESMRNGAQAANRKFKQLSDTTLLQIIAGWGSQMLSQYAGPLMQAEPEYLANFDALAGDVLKQLESQLSKPCTGAIE